MSAGTSLRVAMEALGGLALGLGGKWVPVSPAEGGGGLAREDPLLGTVKCPHGPSLRPPGSVPEDSPCKIPFCVE